MTRIGYHPGAHVRNNVTNFLEDLAAKDPDAVVFRWVELEAKKKWSYEPQDTIEHAELRRGVFADQIARVAAGLTRVGLGHGDRAILFIPMSAQLYVLMAALQRIGAIPVFLDSWARRDQLGASAKMAEPKALISFEMAFMLCGSVPELADIPIKISVGPTPNSYTAAYEELVTEAPEQPVVAVEQEHTGLITFTTGSSGTPKGANRTHRFLAAQHYAIDACIPYGPGDVDLPVFPVFSLNNVAAGVPTALPAIDVGTPGKHDAATLYAQFTSCKVTCATLNPHLFRTLAAACKEWDLSMPGLRRVVTGGAPISRDDLINFKAVAPEAEIWVFYGSTEVEPMAHIEAKEMIDLKTRASEDPDWADEGVNVGHFAEGLRYKFLKLNEGPIKVSAEADWAELEEAAGEPGELIVAGEHVCRDYYNFPEAFEKAKILDVDGTVWHRTGDMVRMDDQGYLWMVGRVHSTIKRGGAYCFPVRAEIILGQLPFAERGAYMGVDDAELGEKTVVVVVPNEPDTLEQNEGQWRAEVERVMAHNDVPVDLLLFRKEIPMDSRHHSKVEYGVLRDQLAQEGAL
jgi:acyl-CoA synthetase (AMP-forming)/AMP-acid ligase II